MDIKFRFGFENTNFITFNISCDIEFDNYQI